MTYRKIFVLYDRESNLYFAGFVKDRETWSKHIEAAHPYDSQKEADTDYEELRKLGYDVMVQ